MENHEPANDTARPDGLDRPDPSESNPTESDPEIPNDKAAVFESGDAAAIENLETDN